MDWVKLESEHTSEVCRALVIVSDGPKGRKTNKSHSLRRKGALKSWCFSSENNLLQKQVSFQGDCLQGLWMLILMALKALQKSGIRVCMQMRVIGEHSSTTPISLIKEPLSVPITAEPDTLTALSTGLLLQLLEQKQWTTHSTPYAKTCLITYPKHHA